MQQPLGSLVLLAAGHSPSQCLTALPAPSEMGPFGVTGQAPANDLLCRTEKASLPEGGGAAQAVTEGVYCAAESAAASLCAVSADPSGASVSGAVSASAAVLSAASEAAAEEALSLAPATVVVPLSCWAALTARWTCGIRAPGCSPDRSWLHPRSGRAPHPRSGPCRQSWCRRRRAALPP